MVFAKKMLLVLHNVVFIENEALLQCVAMRERTRAFAATAYYIIF